MMPLNDNEQSWTGTERRVAGAAEQYAQMLLAHSRDEMIRYTEIIDKIDSSAKASQERHDGMSKAITDFITTNQSFIDGIKRAFPKASDGSPDYDGHRTAHLAWINEDKDARELKQYIKRVVLGAVATALVLWAGSLFWEGALHGPRQPVFNQTSDVKK